jgi:ribose transport system substrate-binding protein
LTIKNAVGATSNIMVVRDPGLSNVAERFAGLKSAISTVPGLKIIADVNDGSDTAKATQAVTAALLANPEVNTVVALTGVGGPAAVTAIREAGLTGKVKVFAVNRDAAILKGVQDGSITAAFAEHPQVEAYQSISLLQQKKCGSLQISNNDKTAKISSLPNGVDAGVTAITKANASQFIRKS